MSGGCRHGSPGPRERVAAMQHARRVASIAATLLVGVLVLTGCRSDPKVAAYVGDTTFTRAQVDRVFDSLPREAVGENPANVRQYIVSMMVVRAVAEQHAESLGKQVPEGATNPSSGMDPESAFAKLQGRYNGAVQLLQSEAKPAEPTEELRRNLFQQLEQAGRLQPGAKFEQVAPVIDSQELRSVVAVRDLLGELARRYDVVVNPAYAPLELHASSVPIANGQATVDVTIPVSVEGASPIVSHPAAA